MSWKATAYVKELREGLTVTDKFVLLMLAEYHRTDDKLTWPSASTLALDCLLRSVRCAESSSASRRTVLSSDKPAAVGVIARLTKSWDWMA